MAIIAKMLKKTCVKSLLSVVLHLHFNDKYISKYIDYYDCCLESGYVGQVAAIPVVIFVHCLRNHIIRGCSFF